MVRFRIDYVPSAPQPPVANFTGRPPAAPSPLAVSFTDQSANTPTAWSWTFGDGGTSTAQNPSHTYSSLGTYTVALTATNAQGNNTGTQSGYITVTAAPPRWRTSPAIRRAAARPLRWPSPTFDRLADRLVLELRGRQHFPDAESRATATRAPALTRSPYRRPTPGGNNTNTKTQLHHLGRGPPVPAANFTGTPTPVTRRWRDLHRHLHQHPDRLVLDLRRQQHVHGAEPEPHLQQRPAPTRWP